MLFSLVRRQYCHRTSKLSDELRRNLLRLYSSLWGLLPRRTPFVHMAPVGAHTDAQGHGGASAVFLDVRKIAASLRPPRGFAPSHAVRMGYPIFLCELCAAILMVYIANEREISTARTCVLRGRNKEAVDALAKGGTSSVLGSILSNLFWATADRGNTRWRIEYARAQSSIPDKPSRMRTVPCAGVCTACEGVCTASACSVPFEGVCSAPRDVSHGVLVVGEHPPGGIPDSTTITRDDRYLESSGSACVLAILHRN